ncbi:MAG: N-formylglutamate amidohydrolase [Myxococcota bacterium]
MVPQIDTKPEALVSPLHASPAEWVHNPLYDPDETVAYPDRYRDRLLIDSIHGGDIFPDHLSEAVDIHDPIIQDAYVREKDWGAEQVARRLAQKLGLPGILRVNVARALLDFGRFPAVSMPGDDHLNRSAINEPFASYLTHDDRRELLRHCFDPISSAFEHHVRGKQVKIAIHTYDKLNAAGTRRPLVSLIYRPVSYQHTGRIPFDVFDRMYPDHLAEFTADRRLVARISLELEKQGITVAYNYPYQLPEGSVEFRSQVWFFFDFLRRQFIDAHPRRVGDPAYEAVWEMLLDTNLRSARSSMLRSYLHLFRLVQPHLEAQYKQIRTAYEDIETFMQSHRIDRAYRLSPTRPSSLALEVRKDFVWMFEDDACRHPIQGLEGARWDNIELITDELARAIRIYLCDDRTPDPGTIPEGRPRRAR